MLAGMTPAAGATVPESVVRGPAELLAQADRIKTSDYPGFVEILSRLGPLKPSMSASQLMHADYLQAWKDAYVGDYALAEREFKALVDQSGDATIRLRALATYVNILGIGHHYEEAFARTEQMLEMMPEVRDKPALGQALGEATQLFLAAGQYDLARQYAKRMYEILPKGRNACLANLFEIRADYLEGTLQSGDPRIARTLDECNRDGEGLFANTLRADEAGVHIRNVRYAAALALLQTYDPQVERQQYRSLISRYKSLEARAYLGLGALDQAQGAALAAVAHSIKDEYTAPLGYAYKVLFEVNRERGDFKAALDWHVKYMAADKGYLNGISARAMAYQVVKQHVQARKQQVEALNRQNRILNLKQQLDHKALETSRLYFALLLMFLFSIAFWAYRLKRSQIRFRNLARLDGLTGVYRRKHLLERAGQVLKQARKAESRVCFILIDLDHFKVINDTHGHALGDAVLVRVAEICRQYLRPDDTFGRLGGEEFGIVLAGTTKGQAVTLAERMRQAIHAPATYEDRLDVSVSASFGVTCTERSGYDIRQMLMDADAALYEAKRTGRNRVVVADPAPVPMEAPDMALDKQPCAEMD